MLTSTLLVAAVPVTQAWSPTIAIVMVVANVVGIVAATRTKKAGPALAGGVTAAQVIGGACFGHILGAGAILGLTGIGAL